jgi:hypothetical protein
VASGFLFDPSSFAIEMVGVLLVASKNAIVPDGSTVNRAESRAVPTRTATLPRPIVVPAVTRPDGSTDATFTPAAYDTASLRRLPKLSL